MHVNQPRTVLSSNLPSVQVPCSGNAVGWSLFWRGYCRQLLQQPSCFVCLRGDSAHSLPPAAISSRLVR